MTRSSLLLPLLGASLLAACGETEFVPAWGDADPPPNILFLTIDTLRTDHLGYDGYDKPTSPNIDAWAETAMIFDNAQASASWTLPGFASALTGTYCSTHRCWGFGNPLDPSFNTVTEILLAAGYDTACVTSHIFLATRFGLQQGFVHFDDSFAHPSVDPKDSITSEMVSDKGIDFLEHKAAADDDTPWLLWLHYFDPHDSYLFHEGFSEPFMSEGADPIQHELDLYDGEIRFTDHHIGRVFDKLAESGLDENTIVVFFSDHGEEFNDHGSRRHGHRLWRELCRVPLAIAGPGITSGRYDPTVRTIDLLPTVLDMAGINERLPADLPGSSLLPILSGDGQAPDTDGSLAEIQLARENKLKSYVEGPWKLIWHIHPSGEGDDDELLLFHIENDPLETRNLAKTEPELVKQMHQRLLERQVAALQLGDTFEHSDGLDFSPSELDDLKGLGYLGNGQTAGGADAEDGR